MWQQYSICYCLAFPFPGLPRTCLLVSLKLVSIVRSDAPRTFAGTEILEKHLIVAES